MKEVLGQVRKKKKRTDKIFDGEYLYFQSVNWNYVPVAKSCLNIIMFIGQISMFVFALFCLLFSRE
jgi:phosphomevalonate kinase